MVDKEIRKLKLSLTQECCLRCTHCYVNKAGSQTISPAQARLGLEFFLSSPGRDKKLELAGGEAFIKFGLLTTVVAAAEELARKYGKKLEIWVASNGLLLTGRHFEFIRKHKIVLSISLYGTAATHDAIRRLPGGGGSLAPLKRKVRAALSALDPNKVTALLCAHPGHTGALYEDFTGILDMGFKVVNIECVHGIPWPAESSRLFRQDLARIIALARSRILAGEFLVFESFIQLIKNRAAGKKLACPLFNDLEIYPDGSFALYPYGFVDIEKYSGRIAVGSVAAGLNARFSGCRPGSAACRTCVKDYYRLPGMRDGAAQYTHRTAAVLKFFHYMARGPRKAEFRPYIKRLVGTFC